LTIGLSFVVSCNPSKDFTAQTMNRYATKQHKALLYVLQDGLCAGCAGQLETFDAHHVVPWSEGGETKTHNLKLLCPPCHKLVHSRRATVSNR